LKRVITLNMRNATLSLLLAAIAAGSVSEAHADGKLTAARQLAEWTLRKFTGKATQEGTEALSKRIMVAAARHGDDLVSAAVRKSGMKALSLADEAAEHAPRVLRFIGKYGDEGAALLTKKSIKLLALGDEAAAALIRHKGVAEPLLESYGSSAVKALASVAPRGGRRLAMMAGGDLAAIGRTPELLAVIARHGDRAMAFVWENKVLLAGGAALAAFLADPEPFINGTAVLGHAVSENVIKPAAAAVTGTLGPGFAAAGDAIRPAIMNAAVATRKFALWLGGWLLIAGLSFFLAVRLVARSGVIGKLIVKSGFKLASGQIVGAIRKK
jgi:hypothetical protein